MEELITVGEEFSEYFLYIITCRFINICFMKIGKSKNLEDRIKNIQTGCPHKIEKVFTISSEFDEEINGVEHYIHYRFRQYNLNGEWYIASNDFLKLFVAEFKKINKGEFTWNEINSIVHEIHFDSLEILLHRHEYVFTEVKKEKGMYQKYESFGFNEFLDRIHN